MPELQALSFDFSLSKANRLLENVQNELHNTENAFRRGDMELAYATAFKLAAQVERLAVCARELPAHTGNPKAPMEIKDMMLKNCGVEVGLTPDEWFCVRMPMILPRKERGDPDYIRSMLFSALYNFFQQNQPFYFGRCVVVFKYIYNRDRPARAYRDHDNIEVNAVMDVLAMYTMKDDSALCCQHYYYSLPGEVECTEIYVLPQEAFPKWLGGYDCLRDEPAALRQLSPGWAPEKHT